MKLLFKTLVAFILTFTCANHSSAQIAGKSLRLKADTNYVSIDDASSLSLNNSMTWEFWIYNRCESDVNGEPISKGWCDVEWSYYISIDTTVRQFVFVKYNPVGPSSCDQTPTVEYRSPIGSIPPNTWTHMALVMNGTSVKFYINGQPVTTTLTSGTPFIGIRNTAEPLLIGAYHFHSNNGNSNIYGDVPKANIDEVRIWHKARTANEILTHYQTTLVGNETGLKAYYKMEQTGSGAGITVTNSAVGSSIPNGLTVGSSSNILFQNNSTVINSSSICSALPLKLLSFNATKEVHNNWLVWTTAQEINVNKFEIERSYNGSTFEKIDQVKAGLTSYTFCDKKSINNTCYYRLKMVDKDGQFSYSKVISVKPYNSTSAEIYPNPITTTATIKLQSEHAKNVQVKIVNNEGKVLSTKTYNLSAGNNQIPLNTSGLTSGIYAVVIVGQNISEHLIFSKQ